jgi:riboflavin synthase
VISENVLRREQAARRLCRLRRLTRVTLARIHPTERRCVLFTGIVEEVGTVVEVQLADPMKGLTIGAPGVLQDARLGDSIAVNGACLTVTALTPTTFAVGVVPETLRRTNLGGLAPGDAVNLERPLLPTSRLGGHFVQGHVDGTGRVLRVEPDGNALNVWIEADQNILQYIVEKGFIAVDGASLTVTRVDSRGFGVSLIPFTQSHTGPGIRSPHSLVNLEVDVLAKYVEKLVIH